MEHCISSFKNRQELKAYKIYMSDVGFQITNAFGKVFGSKDDLIKERFVDIMKETEKKNVKEPETKEEIIERIRNKLRG